MLLLYPKVFAVSAQLWALYIPLCFYYIAVPKALEIYKRSPLHSTMLLLYLWCDSAEPDRIKTLYIPLCFYYIFIKIPDFLLFLPLHSTMLLLYLHILIAVKCMYPALHSTMLLLYPVQKKATLFLICLYIPLCFYYIVRFSVCMGSLLHTLHSTMLLLYPVTVFPFYFLQYRYTFCLPPFLIDFFSKIIHLSLYKV